jgi:hypothetical protein
MCVLNEYMCVLNRYMYVLNKYMCVLNKYMYVVNKYMYVLNKCMCVLNKYMWDNLPQLFARANNWVIHIESQSVTTMVCMMETISNG